MKFFHISDLHLGIKVNGFSMIEEQQYILGEILKAADRETPDAVLISGDVYDKSVPPSEAVRLFDDFLCELSHRNIKAFIISGNHDSSDRLAFGGRLMNASGVYFSPVYNGEVLPITLCDQHGVLNIYLLPFIKPSHVRACFPEEEIQTYTDAVQSAISHMNINQSERNIIVAHQFFIPTHIIDPDSEFVDSSVLNVFDYAALGHIHSSQSVGLDNIRFCGTPIKYSFSECGNTNSITVAEMHEKGRADIKLIELTPKRDWRELKGTYMQLTSKSFYESFSTEDYIHITLTDEDEVPDAIGKLRAIYPNIMHLSYDNCRTRKSAELIPDLNTADRKTPYELFSEFYELLNNQVMTDIQADFIKKIMEEIREVEK